MGVVYVGEHSLLGRKAAIKVLLPELSANKEIVHRFFNEARAVTQIADPGIVQVFDFGYDQSGSAFIIMELLEGEPLDKRLQRVGRLAPVEAVRLMRLICTSLHAAHVKGIIHRDLKPENIFMVGDPAVTGGERAKILDFGIAKLSRDEPGQMKTRTGMMMGTPVYMSPEQCRGAGEVDHRSDIYTIGCVMMTMLTGRPPFEGSGSGELIVAHMQATPPLAASRVPGLLPVIDQILQRCLAKDPGQRFSSMAELAQAWGHAEQLIYSTPGAMPGAQPGSGPWGGSYLPSGMTPAPPGYLPSGPTPPPPGGYTAPGAAAPPTTLSAASGVTPSPARRGRSAGLAVAGVAVIAAVVAVVMATRGGGNDSHAPHAGAAGAPVVLDAAAMAVAPGDGAPLVPDAAVAAAPGDGAPAVVTAPADAAVVDAVVVVEQVIDAGEPAVKRPKLPKHTSGGTNHGRSNAAGSASTVDRGD